jgi:Ca2+-binding RTX toxin-like protein
MALLLESFEGLAPGANIIAWSLADGFLQPGTTGAFTFASGLRLIAPIPNGDAGSAAIIGDFGISLDATWGVGPEESPGDVNEQTVVPLGKAYMGRNVGEDGTLTFGFDQSVFSVGARVNAGDKVSVAAYDAGGKLITGARINEVAAADWRDNFILVNSKKPIAKVVFTGDFLVLDNVSFDTEKFGVKSGSNRNDKMQPGNGGTSNLNDAIFAKKGNDKVFADAGADAIDGGAGNDKLHGGLGNDKLTGGPGKDKLWGDDGQDTFIFTSRDAVDTIVDFNVDDDSIILARSAFPTLDLGSLDDNQFDTSASGPEVRIIYEATSGRLLFDGDGSGGAKAVQFAKLSPGLMLSSEHFFVV